MGNWHCIPSSCAEVVYQPYETGKVRWRYGTEPWQEIIGADDYSSVSSYNLSANQRYRYVASGANVSNGIFQGWQSEFKSGSSYQFNGIQDWYVVFNKMYRQSNGSAGYAVKYGYPPNGTWDHYGDAIPPAGYRSIAATIWVQSQGSWITINQPSTTGIWIIRWEPLNLATATTQCLFKVFKKGVVVHQETRSTCPQVEKIPCSLGANKSIKVEKYSYLDRVEVVPYFYDVRLGGLIDSPGGIGFYLAKGQIPPECLNIYNNDVTSTIPTDFGNYANTPENGYRLQAQICSALGCPPPKYEVICGCQCKRCPGDTCPMPCGDYICCYNDYGVAVDQIHKDDYCGGTT